MEVVDLGWDTLFADVIKAQLVPYHMIAQNISLWGCRSHERCEAPCYANRDQHTVD